MKDLPIKNIYFASICSINNKQSWTLNSEGWKKCCLDNLVSKILNIFSSGEVISFSFIFPNDKWGAFNNILLGPFM